MCKFFSFVTEPENHGGQRFYFDWEYRKDSLSDGNDSHSTICEHFKLKEDVCNKYEYNPLLFTFEVDQINSQVDDRIQAEDWVRKLDFKKVVEPLIIKPIVNPFELPIVDNPTKAQIALLKKWASVGDSVWASVWASVGASVGASVWASVWASVRASVGDSVRASVGDSVWDSVGASVWAYASGYFNIKYNHDFSANNKLWDSGLVPSFDGTTWRLHSGKDAKIVYEITAKELRGE